MKIANIDVEWTVSLTKRMTRRTKGLGALRSSFTKCSSIEVPHFDGENRSEQIFINRYCKIRVKRHTQTCQIIQILICV